MIATAGLTLGDDSGAQPNDPKTLLVRESHHASASLWETTPERSQTIQKPFLSGKVITHRPHSGRRLRSAAKRSKNPSCPGKSSRIGLTLGDDSGAQPNDPKTLLVRESHHASASLWETTPERSQTIQKPFLSGKVITHRPHSGRRLRSAAKRSKNPSCPGKSSRIGLTLGDDSGAQPNDPKTLLVRESHHASKLISRFLFNDVTGSSQSPFWITAFL
ncbi:uncharacterized protein LOC142760543 [Rhinoderma darwinii]|uniref:uncharacterized protein LOC142760543 n=1 Tax=Rhinoderma darwinii TaxID=43563 RepID=UPI003F66C334